MWAGVNAGHISLDLIIIDLVHSFLPTADCQGDSSPMLLSVGRMACVQLLQPNLKGQCVNFCHVFALEHKG